MNVLVLGSGGREHAIVSALLRSPRAPKVYCAPGNAGIAEEAELVPLSPDTTEGIEALADFAESHEIDLTVVGPEAPLVLGVVDLFRGRGLRVFGPDRDAARLEGSKCFTKEFLSRHAIPTAAFAVFEEVAPARAYLEARPVPIVLKADGLAAGKGVIVARTREEALAAVDRILVDRAFGDAGKRLLIEDCLVGSEISVLVVADGEDFVILETAQDYKPVHDGDQGPNTGGMGCYSPFYARNAPLIEDIRKRVIEPTLAGLRADGVAYRGVLYVGIMLTSDGPQVLEFNCRFGDPETQCILPRLKTDIVELFERSIDGTLGSLDLEWDSQHAVCVVAASEGYPGDYPKGTPIHGLGAVSDPSVKVFHAGTALDSNGGFVTAGGRVLGVTALGNERESARESAYRALASIRFAGLQHRSDIGVER